MSDSDYELDENRIEEAALALLSLTLHQDGRVWKGLDWAILNRLHERGWISNPRSKAKSVVMSEEAIQVANRILRERFSRRTDG